MNNIKLTLIMLCFVGFCLRTQAQVVCDLQKASQQYSIGRFAEAEALILPCLTDNNFGKDQLIQAHKLLVLIYIEADNEEKASYFLDKILRASPDYQANPDTDPQEFVNLLQKRTVYPDFTLDLMTGSNITMANHLREFVVLQDKEDRVSSGKLRFGYQAGAQISWFFLPYAGIYGGASIAQHSFGQKDFRTIYGSLDTLKWTYNTSTFLLYNDFQAGLTFLIPSTKTTTNRSPKITTYIKLGYFWGNLLSSRKNLVSITDYYYQGVQSSAGNQNYPNNPTEEMRKSSNYGFTVGVGVGMRYGKNNAKIGLEIVYQHGFANITNYSTRFINREDWLIYDYLDVEGDKTIRSLRFNVFHSLNLSYKVIKKRKTD